MPAGGHTREGGGAVMESRPLRVVCFVNQFFGQLGGEDEAGVPGVVRVSRVDNEALAVGRIWPQSQGSALAGLAVGARAGERTLDVCAAPGGKATQLDGES